MLLFPCLSHLSVLDLKCDPNPSPRSMRSSIITWQLLPLSCPLLPLQLLSPLQLHEPSSCFSVTQAPLPS